MKTLSTYVFGLLFAAFLAMSAASYISGLMDAGSATIKQVVAP